MMNQNPIFFKIEGGTKHPLKKDITGSVASE